MKVVFTQPSLDELDEILTFLATRSRPAAQMFASHVEALADLLARWPEAGRRVERRPDLRVAAVRRFPVRVFYRVVDDSVEIIHIRHAARQPWQPPF